MKTIMVVCGYPIIKKMIAMLLENEDYRLITADSGEEAATVLVTQESPDLLVSDLSFGRMSGMTGCKLAELYLSANDKGKVLLMSGGPYTEKYPFISRPFGREDLIRKIHELLEEQ